MNIAAKAASDTAPMTTRTGDFGGDGLVDSLVIDRRDSISEMPIAPYAKKLLWPLRRRLDGQPWRSELCL
jgi:hypothetical protein